jgi:hypothetical protein
MIYFSLPGDRTKFIKNNTLELLLVQYKIDNKKNKRVIKQVINNNPYTTILSFENDVFYKYFKLDIPHNVYRQIKYYNPDNIPFKYEIIENDLKFE